MEIKGKVKNILAVESGEGKNGKSWQRQDFVIEYMDGNFEKLACFTARNESIISKVAGLRSGQEINVHFNVESREYNGKYYTNLNAWKLEASESKTDLPF